MQSRDARFDGWFFVAVSSTRIYCRPSCPARRRSARTCSFYPTAAAAQTAGYRACLRCRPDAAPGSPEWNLRAGVAGRAMRLIADGLVDREGVDGLARRLAYSPRHLRRLLAERAGAGPLELARAQRAQTARTAHRDDRAAVHGSRLRGRLCQPAPVQRHRARGVRPHADGVGGGPAPQRRLAAGRSRSPSISLRLPHRSPFHAAGLLEFSGRAGGARRGRGRGRHLPPHAAAAARRRRRRAHAPQPGTWSCTLLLADLRDLAAAVSRCRAAFDLDADPAAVDAALAPDGLLAALVRQRPGAARAGDGRRRRAGDARGAGPADKRARGAQHRRPPHRGARRATPSAPRGRCAHLPDGRRGGAADPALLPMPAARRTTLQTLAAALADGRITPDAGADRDELRRRLLEIPGIGAWTASYILMRAPPTRTRFRPATSAPASALDEPRPAPRRRGAAQAARARRAVAALARVRRPASLGRRRPERSPPSAHAGARLSISRPGAQPPHRPPAPSASRPLDAGAVVATPG